MLGVQILETRTEAPEVLGALGTLSTFYNENTPAARRSLRSNIDKRGLQINEEFLAAAGSVIQSHPLLQRHQVRWPHELCASQCAVLSRWPASLLALLCGTVQLLYAWAGVVTRQANKTLAASHT